MSASSPETDLLDLKLLPSWVKDPPVANDYSNFEGEIAETKPRKGAPHRKQGHPSRSRGAEKNRQQLGRQRARTHGRAQSEAPVMRLPAVAVRFLPRISSLQHVIAQIRSEHLAYSVFALARLFLEKPERYEVRLTATAETPFFQLGENGPISTNQRLLEASAFSWAKEEFYKIETVQSDPIKGNFSNVARCRASGTLLGPTNHHSYQLQLRNLYEQRYSRRMSFADYQRQIEIVNDPVAIEQWKEQARNVTTYTTIAAQPELTFNNTTEVERHFRQNHLPGLIRSSTTELTISGVLSRRLPDRALGRVIENAWTREIRSPSNMMQELAGALRYAGLHIFRHRRGMLFTSSVHVHSFGQLASVSSSISRILEAVGATPGIHRKELAERLIPAETDNDEKNRSKMTLASDLKWLISEGYLIEFNDGSFDLPRAKSVESKNTPNDVTARQEKAETSNVNAAMPTIPQAEGNALPEASDAGLASESAPG